MHIYAIASITFGDKLKHMAWIYLVIAGLFEVGFTTSLKLSNNFSNRLWSVLFFICISLSFYFLNRAIQIIPIGTAYAVWTGIGAVGTVIMGIIFFREPSDFWRLFFIFLLIGSIAGLKLVSSQQ
jgi:quaternary ammonium compound-resistance protein SugE